jgi:hypothetical protein
MTDKKRLTPDGLPRDGRDWQEQDWRDLHNAIEEVKKKVSERHARPEQPAPERGRDDTGV